MRMLTIFAVGAALALTSPAQAQDSVQNPSRTEQAPDAQPAETVRNVVIIERENLSPTEKSQVDAVVSETSEGQLQELRKSIDAIPRVSSALKARGFSSAQVIAVSLTQDGVLTLVTKAAT
jgi:hypothetical protein